jgi:ABC-type oligopeptide transport system substrate-binding subunit
LNASKPNRIKLRLRRSRLAVVCALLLVFSLTHTSCFSNEPSAYYGKVVPPRTQEFRWSNGGLPQTFDPAFAAAPPDTDAVRALFEGLTDYDPRTLDPVPGVATRWESSNEGRIWTFYLRDNARWSNGEKVTADDFVRSWERTLKIGPLAPHTELLANIEGAAPEVAKPSGEPETKPATPARLGVRALNEHTLQVTLLHPDQSFPAVVAHPVFRPVKVADADSTTRLESRDLISNGAFQLSATETDRVRLERAKTYWDEDSVALEKVTFVNTASAEEALTAYEDGQIDAITNAPFEPLALKLLAPYKDFRRSTFNALTYYRFNTAHEPFNDVRVREALAFAIDRERVSRDDLGGSTEPAERFLPQATPDRKPVVNKTESLHHDAGKARELLAEAGYPDGEGFPTIRLLINRNEQQRIVAQSIANMWRTTLNVETEIIIRHWDDYEAAMKAGDYDVARRGIVMPTTSEVLNLRLLFGRDSDMVQIGLTGPNGSLRPIAEPREKEVIRTEAQALEDLHAVPIYFASSYSMVKPYVTGFDPNVLDAACLKKTRLDTKWTHP